MRAKIDEELRKMGFGSPEFNFEITDDRGPFPFLDVDAGCPMIEIGGYVECNKTIYCRLVVKTKAVDKLFHVKIHSTKDWVRSIEIRNASP